MRIPRMLCKIVGFFYERIYREPDTTNRPLPWIDSPVDETNGLPRLHRRSDATPIELFFDLFFVANLSTFTATHEITNVNALGAYIGFLGIIWFTWLQVSLFDIRFARDSIFERFCKAIQLSAMVGFASTGTRFTTHVHGDNFWAFQSLSLILCASRMLLAIQYTITVAFMYTPMRPAIKGLGQTAAIFWTSSFLHLGMYFAFNKANQLRSRVWTVWFVLFAIEMWAVMGVSYFYPAIGFQETHLNVRMGLLTLIIIGEGVISVTRIVNKTVRPGGWTKWSFVHILGVTTNVVGTQTLAVNGHADKGQYLLWQAYFDVSPKGKVGKMAQLLWVQLHFAFHVSLILLLEGSQILALTLDVALKLGYLAETFLFVCEELRPQLDQAVQLIRSTISDMEIPFSRGATQEWTSISSILEDMAEQPLCPEAGTFIYFYTTDLINDLMGNVTAALFSSMGITPKVKGGIGLLDNKQLLHMYMKLLSFVYVYFFTVACITMLLLGVFVRLTRRHSCQLHQSLSIAVRVVIALILAALVAFSRNFSLAYSFMTSPVILYAFTLTLFTDWLASRDNAVVRRKRERDIDFECLDLAPGMFVRDSPPSATLARVETSSEGTSIAHAH